MHRIGAHQPTASQTTTNSQPSRDSATAVRRNARSIRPSTSAGSRPSRSTMVTAVSSADTTAMTAVPASPATSRRTGPSAMPTNRPTASTASRTRPPARAARTSAAWLASTPNQGASRSSRRSNVPSAATHIPATGPPRIIAAAMNGRWRLRAPWPPGSRTMRSPPIRANTVHAARPATPPHGSATPGIAIVGRSPAPGTRSRSSVDPSSTAAPATIVMVVYAPEEGRAAGDGEERGGGVGRATGERQPHATLRHGPSAGCDRRRRRAYRHTHVRGHAHAQAAPRRAGRSGSAMWSPAPGWIPDSTAVASMPTAPWPEQGPGGPMATYGCARAHHRRAPTTAEGPSRGARGARRRHGSGASVTIGGRERLRQPAPPRVDAVPQPTPRRGRRDAGRRGRGGRGAARDPWTRRPRRACRGERDPGPDGRAVAVRVRAGLEPLVRRVPRPVRGRLGGTVPGPDAGAAARGRAAPRRRRRPGRGRAVDGLPVPVLRRLRRRRGAAAPAAHRRRDHRPRPSRLRVPRPRVAGRGHRRPVRRRRLLGDARRAVRGAGGREPGGVRARRDWSRSASPSASTATSCWPASTTTRRSSRSSTTRRPGSAPPSTRRPASTSTAPGSRASRPSPSWRRSSRPRPPARRPRCSRPGRRSRTRGRSSPSTAGRSATPPRP